MTVRPIIFSAPMVRALLEGRKTQTRRVLKPQPISTHDKIDGLFRFCIHDLLYVRESFCALVYKGQREIYFRATGYPFIYINPETGEMRYEPPWQPSIHMPRWASRLTLEVTGVKVERLQDTSEEDARAEGCEATTCALGLAPKEGFPSCRSAYALLWNDINEKRGFGWDANPWVGVLTFRVIHQNVDQFLAAGANDTLEVT